MFRLRKARRKVGFFASDEEEYWYTDLLGVGSIMDLVHLDDPNDRRGLFSRKRETPPQKPTFGFGRVLDE